MRCARNRTPRVVATNRLKISRKWPSKQFSTVIRADGLLVLPPGLTEWRPNQRVFFAILSDQLAISARPNGAHNGRLLSTRVRIVRFPRRRSATAQRRLWHCSDS